MSEKKDNSVLTGATVIIAALVGNGSSAVYVYELTNNIPITALASAGAAVGSGIIGLMVGKFLGLFRR
jgi:hypothetical protein